MPSDPPTMGRAYKSYKAPGTRPQIFHEVSATARYITEPEITVDSPQFSNQDPAFPTKC